jgi:hypothetical protein
MTQTSNGFERHGIDHLSASSINLWANAPDVWVMQYLHGLRTPMGAAAWRGICTEDAVVQILMGDHEAASIDRALAKFDKRFPIGDEKTSAERARIKPMTQLAIEELIEFGKPEFPEVEDGDNLQEKISITAKSADGSWSIPVIGYLDLVFPQHGVVIDLKTTGRIPSTMSAEHQLQRAIYAKAKGNMDVRFLYVSEKKTSMLADGDPTELLAQAKVQISRIEAFLRHCDKDTAKAIVPVQPSSFYWSGNEQLRKEFYGI